MIKGNFSAYYEKVGVSKLDTDHPIGESLNNSWNDFIDRPQNYGLGITINIPIIDWGENKAQVRAAEARMQKPYQQEVVNAAFEREVLNWCC